MYRTVEKNLFTTILNLINKRMNWYHNAMCCCICRGWLFLFFSHFSKSYLLWFSSVIHGIAAAKNRNGNMTGNTDTLHYSEEPQFVQCSISFNVLLYPPD